jgi:hypothetical protein
MSYNQPENRLPSLDIQRQEYNDRVERAKTILNEEVRPVFERLIKKKNLRWDDQLSAIIGESRNNFDDPSDKRNNLVSISLLLDKKTISTENNQFKDTCSEIRIAYQNNNFCLAIATDSTHFQLFTINEEPSESMITDWINHPPITRTID